MLKKLKSKRGEGYIDICISVLVFVMLLVVFINVMSLITLHQDMAIICDNLIETATATGEFGTEFQQTHSDMSDKYGQYDLEYEAEEFLSDNKVQLGKRMTVTISIETYVKGLGAFKIPITVKVNKYGLSERYWK